MNNSLETKNNVWGPWASLSFLIISGITTILMATILTIIALKIINPSLDLDTILDNAFLGNNDLVLISTALAFVLNVSLWILFCKFRKGLPTREYIAIKPVPAKIILFWLGCGLLFLFLEILLEILLDGLLGTAASEFWIKTLANTSALPLILLIVCIVAPICEEIIFRGFFYQGLSRSRLGAAGAIIITSLSWAILHFNDSVYYIGIIFAGGLLLGAARAKTGSIIPPVMIHMVMNIMASTQMILYVNA